MSVQSSHSKKLTGATLMNNLTHCGKQVRVISMGVSHSLRKVQTWEWFSIVGNKVAHISLYTKVSSVKECLELGKVPPLLYFPKGNIS